MTIDWLSCLHFSDVYTVMGPRLFAEWHYVGVLANSIELVWLLRSFDHGQGLGLPTARPIAGRSQVIVPRSQRAASLAHSLGFCRD